MPRTALVTVGTTEFDLLIQKLCTPEILNLLKRLSVSKLIVQFGRGATDPAEQIHTKGILLDCYRYKPSLAKDIAEADLIIGHAGAGTCLECLEAGKLLVVVSNDQLHDQHQAELADRFAEEGYLLHCIPESLADCLKGLLKDANPTVLYSPGNPALFSQWFFREVFQ